jgi:chromosome segregation ATPase
MRMNKLSELVHSSSSKEVTHEVNYAQVEVFFQDILDDETDPDRFEIVPNT